MMHPFWMLDTDTASFLIKERFPLLTSRFQEMAPSEVCISVARKSELLYGLQSLNPAHQLHAKVRSFLRAISIVAWDEPAAEVHPLIRHRLKTRGTPIGDMDLLIAAHAISLGAVLVTNNTRHFGRLAPLLTIENWVEAT